MTDKPPVSAGPSAAQLPAHSTQSGVPDHQNADPPPTILTFSDVPTHLLQLGPADEYQRQRDPSPASDLSNSESNTPNSALSATKSAAHHPRKPSPGLAARLKALGFGPSTQSSSNLSPSQASSIGRLPEDQLRQLDKNHLTNSTGVVIERRGRPWKGAGAPLQLLRSKSGRNQEAKEATSPASSQEPCVLPEIKQAPPLEMDTNKYRLPDHTNGNGTKVQLDVRQAHIERDASAPEFEPQTPPPPPLPKDTPPEGTAPSDFTPDLPSYFNPLGLQRTGSIYTISRLSFANQLAQLTALQLPDAESLSNKVAAIPTAQAASKALIGAADQIRSWIAKASEVISGLDSEDDVEWSAAGGREGYEDVENAITRFEELINVYVGAIEQLQGRSDIGNVSPDDLTKAVTQMEAIMREWRNIRTTLNNVKGQVETAMEWEELWNMVLGDIQNELDELRRLVFEMEERRHKSIMAVSSGDSVDIGDLETIVEETPPAVVRNNRFSLPAFPLSPGSPGAPTLTQDDSSLLALFARMQPLRASLDFLPMRLSVFEARASEAFPTACDELDMRREGLEATYKKLEKDAESLRKELGEDKWVLVFRGAGRQAQKMIESVDRSMSKLREAIDQGLQLSNPPAMGKKIESYEAKKMHYGPAIDRVLSIIERGVKDRLTVNGEILRLHTEMETKWEDVKGQLKILDGALEEFHADAGSQQLRDSISSMLSNDRSTLGSGHETPGSSPPSSVIMSGLGVDPMTPSARSKSRSASLGSNLAHPLSARRGSSNLAPPSQISRRTPGSRFSTLSASSSMSTPSRSGSATPMGTRLPRATPSNTGSRPRWNTSTNTTDSDLGHNFKPLSLTTPSPYAQRSTPGRSGSALTPGSRESKLPARSPLAREASSSPLPEGTPSRRSGSRMSFRDRIVDRISSPGPYSQQSLMKSRLSSHPSMSTLEGNRRSSLQPPRPKEGETDSKQRPASSLAATRRTSLLPQPASRENTTGRSSPQAIAGARNAMRKNDTKAKDSKPRWR